VVVLSRASYSRYLETLQLEFCESSSHHHIMPTYKLLYFNLRGIGELVRLLFKQAGVEFEDFRFSRDEDWHKYIDGKTVWFVNFSDSVQ